LLSGRSESLISTRAIADSPIIGHGSWARSDEYANMHRMLLRERGFQVAPKRGEKAELIPSHSYILGSWVEAGVLSVPLWVTVFLLALFAFLRTSDLRSPYLPLVGFCAAQLLWSVPFSPFGASERFMVSVELLVVIWALRSWQAPRTEKRLGVPRLKFA